MEQPQSQPAAGEPAAAPPSIWARLRRHRWFRFACELAVVIAVISAVQAWRGRDLVASGSDAPPLLLRDLNGQVHRLSDYRGRPVLLHFWATWCGVCRQEFGALNAVEASRGEAVLLTVVEDGEDGPALNRFAATNSLAYPVLRGSDTLSRQWGVSVYPTSFYIDRDGRIQTHQMGMTTRWSMRFWLWWTGLG